ncbi:MAG TPA: zinc-ribbon domain-containing protein [Trebonia sp.]|jgi:hypothetical protein|nr:zinc-ribbon domain-containing protein [Trebonia sp.]
MFFIFGSRYYFWTTNQGTFQCPKCQASQPYRHRKGRKFIHLFFIPLIPISATTEHIKCGGCKTRYKPSVLTQPAAV